MRAAQVSRSLTAHLRTQTFGALSRHPNYRLYWLGALVSNVGTWIQMVAVGWLVYDLTGSALYLGTVGFATALPSLVLPLFGGVLADRFERRRLMLWTQAAAMLLAFLVAYLTLSGLVTVWHLMVIGFLAGAVNALNTPVRQTIISDLVSRDDLGNAIAMNSAQFQTSRMLGPALAGVLVAAVGPGWCFVANGLSFLVLIGVLLALRLPPRAPAGRPTPLRRNLAEGVRYVRGEPTLLSLLGLAAVPALFGMPYQMLMPAFAASVLAVDARGLGLLLSAAGLGAVVGALGVASLRAEAPRGRLMVLAAVGFGLCLVAFALSRWLPLSLLLLVGAGAASMAYNALNQTFVQSLAADEMRGRVMSILTLATFGLQPFGTLQAGAVASLLGPSAPVLAGGAIVALYALWTLARGTPARLTTREQPAASPLPAQGGSG